MVMGICIFDPEFTIFHSKRKVESYGMKCESCGGAMHLVSGVWVCESCQLIYDQEGKPKMTI